MDSKAMDSKVMEVNLTKKPTKDKKTIIPKKHVIRKETNRWHFDNKYMEFENQWICLKALLENDETVDKEVCREMKRQIQNKISSYKMQDILKDKYNADKFVDLNFVISLLHTKKLNCFYCKESVYLFYNFVRENKQWTLERVYNEYGHNKDNVEIACLNCNLRRRTMYHERFVFTKQLKLVKLQHDEIVLGERESGERERESGERESGERESGERESGERENELFEHTKK